MVVELFILTQLTNTQPKTQYQQQTYQNTYQAPKYQSLNSSESNYTSSSKRIQEFEEEIFTHPD